MALVIPIFLILAGSAIAYYFYPTPFLIGVVAALTSADVLVWRELRSTLHDQMIQIWDNYLRRIRDVTAAVVLGQFNYFPQKYEQLESKIGWVRDHGKYGRFFKLYPAKLVKENLVTDMLRLGYDFNSKLEQMLASSRVGGFELNVQYAFDHWGLRKIPADQQPRLASLDLMKQNLYLEGLDKQNKQEVTELIESWKKPFKLSERVVLVLEKFRSENGIMPSKPATLSAGFVP